MKQNKRKKINWIKLMEYITTFILNIEAIYMTYYNVASFKKTMILLLSIAITIKLLKKEK